tara:strand:- start:102 stop:701 length:600 start_codon:yes stop_codon:yes gene_type:complete
MSKNSVIQGVKGTCVPVRGADIDTDRIIPARYLRTVTFEHLGSHAFEDDRKGGLHPFDNPSFASARILIANANFGCGSSREHAPQALMRWGIRGFIAESFAEIFFGNCTTLGLPCVVASSEEVKQLQSFTEDHPSQEIEMHIVSRTVSYGGKSISVNIPDGVRDQLIKGTWDSLGQLIDADDHVSETARSLPYTSNFSL